MTDFEKDLSRIKAQLRSWKADDVEQGLREFQHRRSAGERLDRCIAQIQSRVYRWGPEEVEAGLKEFQFRRRETSHRSRRSIAWGAANSAVTTKPLRLHKSDARTVITRSRATIRVLHRPPKRQIPSMSAIPARCCCR